MSSASIPLSCTPTLRQRSISDPQAGYTIYNWNPPFLNEIQELLGKKDIKKAEEVLEKARCENLSTSFQSWDKMDIHLKDAAKMVDDFHQKFLRERPKVQSPQNLPKGWANPTAKTS